MLSLIILIAGNFHLNNPLVVTSRISFKCFAFVDGVFAFHPTVGTRLGPGTPVYLTYTLYLKKKGET